MKLIPDWKKAWRYWSVRLNAIGLAIMSWVFWDPNALLWLFNALPRALRPYIPYNLYIALAIIIFGVALIARLVKQPKVEDNAD